MTFAIIEQLGHQYIIKNGDTVTVNGHLGKLDNTFDIEKVLLFHDGQTLVGTPKLDIQVSAKIIDYRQSEKIRVSTYKSKSRYRKVKGHRQDQTILKIISLGKPVSPASPKPVSPKTAPVSPPKTNK